MFKEIRVPIKKELATMDLSVADIDMALSHMVLFTNNIDEVQKIHDEYCEYFRYICLEYGKSGFGKSF